MNKDEVLQRVFEIYKENGFKPYRYELFASVLIFKKTVGKERYKEIRQEAMKYADEIIMPKVKLSFDENWSDRKELNEMVQVFKETDDYVIIPLSLVNTMNHKYWDKIK